jgi:hypothetical protein
MKAAAIKHLAGTQPLSRLRAAEQALLAGRPTSFFIDGDTPGEQLTHVLAAIFALRYMAAHGVGWPAAQRAFFCKVREAITC